MTQKSFQVVLVAVVAAAFLAKNILAGDWPTYKSDSERSGVSSEQLKFPLATRWIYEPSLPPMPAWPEPGKELHRMDFDYAFQPVAAGGLVYFASSADDTVRALNAATGELMWRFTANGPIRFAPAIAKGKAYVAPDDGWLYCLDAKTGKEVWRFHGAPGSDQILGNGRMISRWPCRTGALVVDGVVYFIAGMWPTEGVYVYALDAETGKELWCNDSSGAIYIDLPHPGATGFSGVSPQGYLLASKDILLVPTGRCVPAAFDRHTGRLLYYKPAVALMDGGSWATAAGDLYFNPKNRFQNPSEAFVGEAQPCPSDGMIAYSFASGEQEFLVQSRYRVLVSDDVLYAVGGGVIQSINLKSVRRDRSVQPKSIKWTTPHTTRVYCLALAGQALLAGNRDSITAFDIADGKQIWSCSADGQVRGLAIAEGRLIAGTHKGTLLCFEHGGAGDVSPRQVKEKTLSPAISPESKRTAKDIVQMSGKLHGYACIIGEPDARLAEALAMQTDLHVVSLLHGNPQVAVEREHLLAAGLYGRHVAVHGVDDPAHLPLSSYFADLVVVSGKAKNVSAKECYRVLRPCGGALCFVGFSDAEKQTFIKNASIPQDEIAKNVSMIVRGTLPGAAEWRYPWADGGRSGAGKDTRVRLPMDLLWFGGPGPDRLVDRHLMTSGSVSANGRVFMTGEHHVVTFDAYNGRELWSRHIEGVGRKYAQYYSSTIVADDDSVYVIQSDKCHRLDQATGKTIFTYNMPESVIKDTPPPLLLDYVDVEWPKVWQAVGPFPNGPKGKPPLKPDDFKTIPKQVTAKGKEYTPARIEAVNDIIDFTTLYGGYGFKPLPPGEKPAQHPQRGTEFSYTDVGRICYAFAKINCPKAGKLLVGAGADWWMQWFLDGKPVFDTLKDGNIGNRYHYFSKQPCSPKDFLFGVDVTPGEHVLAVMVKSGSRGWALASASMAKHAKEMMPIATGANLNLPNLRDMIWGYLSVTDDLLLGSYNVPLSEGQPAESHLIWRSESKAAFALNKKDGTLRWVYRPKPDRIVCNIEIAFGDGRLFLVDGTSKADLVQARRRKEKIEAKLTLVALNLADGKELWRQDDVPLLRDRTMPTRLKSNITHLFMGLPNWGHLVYANGVVVLGVNAAYDAATGRKLWSGAYRTQKLPIVVGKWLIAQPYAFDLHTGEQRMANDLLTGAEATWRYGREYGCGPVNGCPHLLFFRSGTDGFFDMNVQGTTNFGGIRPGCSRSILVANGLLIHPEGYSGCCCSYNYQTCMALVPGSDQTNWWYVLPRLSSSGLIKHIAVNFGAPGDQKDNRGTAWLGFPRPVMASACPTPVTILMENSTCYFRRRATASIKGTDAPWLYSSGLRGRGHIIIGLVLQPNLVIPTHHAEPTIDGKLDDPCWNEVNAVPFENTPFTMLGANVELRIFKDAKNFYFAYRRKPIANARTDIDEATLGKNDDFEIYIADQKKKIGIRFGIKRNGEAFAKFGTVDRYRKVDPTWKGEWEYAVTQTPKGWAAEVAIPVKTLTDSGLDLRRLQLNCMSQNLTQSGLEAIFLVDPRYGRDFKRCVRFRVVGEPSAEPPKERSFTVRLHFAEIDDLEADRRVFDVAVQGNTVLENFDIVKEAGGENIAFVKEFKGIQATGTVSVELVPRSGSKTPILSAVEVSEE